MIGTLLVVFRTKQSRERQSEMANAPLSKDADLIHPMELFRTLKGQFKTDCSQ